MALCIALVVDWLFTRRFMDMLARAEARFELSVVLTISA